MNGQQYISFHATFMYLNSFFAAISLEVFSCKECQLEPGGFLLGKQHDMYFSFSARLLSYAADG
jgi:hypothetical protein